MLESSMARFALTLFVALVVAFTVAAIVSPPDPYSQLIVAGVLMAIALPVAYYLSYRGGYDSIRGQ